MSNLRSIISFFDPPGPGKIKPGTLFISTSPIRMFRLDNNKITFKHLDIEIGQALLFLDELVDEKILLTSGENQMAGTRNFVFIVDGNRVHGVHNDIYSIFDHLKEFK